MSLCFFIFLFSYFFFTIDIYFSYCKKPNQHKIEIIEIISKEYNELENHKNILKFLKNIILNSDDVFEEYNRPVKIRYRYKNSIYCMCLKYITKRTNLNIINNPDIMFAQILGENYDKIDVTKKLRELHGHTKNYYEHINGCYNNFFFITLKEYSGNTIEIMDMYGKILKIKIP